MCWCMKLSPKTFESTVILDFPQERYNVLQARIYAMLLDLMIKAARARNHKNLTPFHTKS